MERELADALRVLTGASDYAMPMPGPSRVIVSSIAPTCAPSRPVIAKTKAARLSV